MKQNQEVNLFLPSGLSHQVALNYAKISAGNHEYGFHQYLDTIAIYNSYERNWAEASKKSTNITPPTFSYNSCKLRELYKSAVDLSKKSGLYIVHALRFVCDIPEIKNPLQAAVTLHVPPTKMEIHRFMFGFTLILVSFEEGYLILAERELSLHPKSKGINRYYHTIPLTHEIEFRYLREPSFYEIEEDFKIKLDKGWWIFNLRTGRPDIDFTTLSDGEVLFIANFLGFELTEVNGEFSQNANAFNSGTSQLYSSLKTWITKNPRESNKMLEFEYFSDLHKRALSYIS